MVIKVPINPKDEPHIQYMNELRSIIGLKIIDIQETTTQSGDSEVRLILENNQYIIGLDGEYGDNVLELVDPN